MMLSHYFVEDISRREANLAFIAFSIFCITFWMALESLCVFSFECLQFFSVNRSLNSASYVNKGMSNNGLLIFIVANLLTGLINLTINTKSSGLWTSMFILIFYLFPQIVALFL